MIDPNWLWPLFAMFAAAAQTVRNASQSGLTRTLGTVGATHVRFLFGFPFALLMLLGLMLITGDALPRPPLVFAPWVLLGALMQITATALMLAAMGERSFLSTIAYTKTEPVQVALFGLVFLGDRLTPLTALAIVIATGGVVLMSIKPGRSSGGGIRAPLMGLAAGGLFALSAVGFRGAVLSLDHPSFVMSATFSLVIALLIQAALLSAYLWWRDRAVLIGVMKAWRPSVLAGFTGALASQFWFLSFALTTAANVRTLALVEVLYAQAVSRFVFKQPATWRELFGIMLVVGGVVLLIWVH